MLGRLGNVLYWTGSGIAALFLFLTALHLVSKQSDVFPAILFAAVAVLRRYAPQSSILSAVARTRVSTRLLPEAT